METTETQKRLEVCQYKQYALRPEVSSPPGSGFSAMAYETDTQADNAT